MITLNNDTANFEETQISIGDVLFKKGDKCQFSYIVKSGHIACFSLSKDNRVIPLFSVVDNGLIGEDNVFSEGGTYGYYAVALSSTKLIKLPNKDVMTYLNSAGDWMKKILFDLAEKVSNTGDILVEHKIVDDRLNGGKSFSQQDEKALLQAIS